MDHRPLGSTGLFVSELGYGSFKIGRNRQHRYAADYDLPGEHDVDVLLNSALDLGITLIDTAPAYGVAEERIGRAIGHRRDEFVLATKVGETFEGGVSHFDFSAAAVRASIEASLRRLRTDRLDLVCVHSDGRDVAIQQQTDVIEALRQCRQRGLVRAIGFSAKSVDGARAAIEWADVLMVTFHCEDTSHADVIAAAAAAGRGVLVKKGLASGHLPAGEAIRFVLDHPAVSSLLISTLSPQHLAANVAAAASTA